MKPRPFQLAAVDAAITALESGSRRFLLADEVGLGKTVVAREVVRRLAAKAGDVPLNVFYVTSNQTLSAQNAPRLMPKEGDAYQLLAEGRPSLLPNADFRKTAQVRIFRFSPHTSIPLGHGRPRGGVVAERALLFILWKRVLKLRVPRGLRKVFVGTAEKSFVGAAKAAASRYRQRRLLRGYDFAQIFKEEVRSLFGIESGTSLSSGLEKALQDQYTEKEKSLIGKLRLALTRAALRCVPPGLVIFDEFHRYKEVAFRLPAGIQPNPGGHPTFLDLLSTTPRPRILLISATPFRMSSSPESHSGHFDALVGFLHGDGDMAIQRAKQCRDLFVKFETELSAERFSSDVLLLAKQKLEQDLLRPRMARMERAMVVSVPGGEDGDRCGSVLPGTHDIDALLRFASGLDKRDSASSVAYWRSVPLPHQTLGPAYKIWDRAQARRNWQKLPSVHERDREKMRLPAAVSHPKLNELLKRFPPDQLALPWLAPSAPWWSLRGPWSDRGGKAAEKGLLFCHYRAAPAGISGLVSLAVETWAARKSRWHSHRELGRRSFLAPKSIATVMMFHPSSWLARSVDPLTHPRSSIEETVSSIAGHLAAALPADVRISREPAARRPVWHVLAMLERRLNIGPSLRDVWGRVLDRHDEGQLARALQRVEDVGRTAEAYVTAPELDALAMFALSAPGVVLLRSLSRHWGEVYDVGLPEVAELAWSGLRSYLDQPWFVARLRESRNASYARQLQNAIYDGNLEACLDEHFWLLGADDGAWCGKHGRLALLRQSLALRAAPVLFHKPGVVHGRKTRLSAHVALPLTAKTSAEPAAKDKGELRAEDLRRAFNTPFWPHLLCTTSVGQEGLDFHQWCRTVVHWDLPGGPVELEQREGRVDRYRGLAVRRTVPSALRNIAPGEVGWSRLGALADEMLGDESGLAPWWIAEGANIRRMTLDAPSSEERLRRNELERLRKLYRLVLGTPNQWNLLRRIESSMIDVDQARAACWTWRPGDERGSDYCADKV